MTHANVPEATLSGRTYGLIADAHVHPGRTPDLPAAVFEAFRGADGIIALGDMGESAGLDALETVAPLLVVRGADDAEDGRVGPERRVFTHDALTLGAVFDGTRHGVLRDNDPLAPVGEFAAATERTFGRPLEVLLCAASHKPHIAWCDGILVVNPGSPTLADQPSVALLHLHGTWLSVQHVMLT